MRIVLVLCFLVLLGLIGCGKTTTEEATVTESTTVETTITETTAVETVFNLSFLNGSGIDGITAKTSELFKNIKYTDDEDKYNIVKVADADNHNYENTQIICKSKDSDIVVAAEEIKSILNVETITTQQDASQDSDIIIIIGKDFN